MADARKVCPSCKFEIPLGALICGYCRTQRPPNPEHTRIRWHRAVAINCAIGGTVIALFVFRIWMSESASEVRGSSATPQATAEQERKTAPQPITFLGADKLLAEYRVNEVAADLRYRGRYIEVHGIVGSVANDIWDKPYIEFRPGNVVFGVRCSFPRSARPLLAEMGHNEIVSVVGRCEGKFGYIQLGDCRFGAIPPEAQMRREWQEFEKGTHKSH
jgi:tRNA_anti-like